MLYEDILSAPEFNVLKHDFLPLELVSSTPNIREQTLIRNYYTWNRRKTRIVDSIPKTKLSRLRQYHIVPTSQRDLTPLSPLLRTLNPLCQLRGKAENCISTFENDSRIVIVDQIGNYRIRSIRNDDSNSTLKFDEPKFPSIFSSPLYGICVSRLTNTVRIDDGFVVIDVEESKILNRVYNCDINDVSYVDTSRIFASTRKGSVIIYDCDRSKKISTLNIPQFPSSSSYSYEWCLLRDFQSSFRLVSDRKRIHLIDDRISTISTFIQVEDYIGTIIKNDDTSPSFYVVSPTHILLYDVRKRDQEIWKRRHDLNCLPTGGCKIRNDETNYFACYTRDGDVAVWATEDKIPRGHVIKLSVNRILNESTFDDDEPTNRICLPWTGITAVNGVNNNKSLYLVAVNCVGDLFYSEIQRGIRHDKTSDFKFWLLHGQDGQSQQAQKRWIEEWGKRCSEVKLIKKSCATRIYLRPKPPSSGLKLKRSIPKVRRRKNNETSQKCKTISRKKTPYSRAPGFKLFHLDSFNDEDGKRINKIFSNESIFPNLPSDVESDSTYRSDSLKSRSSDSNMVPSHELPNDSSYMMKQFLRDLGPNATSTQDDTRILDEEEEGQMEEFTPLTAGLSQEYDNTLSQPFSQSFRAKVKSSGKKRKKTQLAGF